MAKRKVVAGLEALDEMNHLKARANKKGQREISGGKNDAVREAMDKCSGPSEIGTLAVRAGLLPEEVILRGKRAPNFGQFRMLIGNRIRGTLARIEAARKKGENIPDHVPADRLLKAAYPKKKERDPEYWSGDGPPVKKATKKTPAKKAAKAAAPAVGAKPKVKVRVRAAQ